MSDRPLFRSVDDALRFAFNPERQVCDRPATNRMCSTVLGTAGELSGLDGAGQAGIIRRRLSQLPHLQQSILVARYAPLTLKCECKHECCRGWMPYAEWQAAVRIVADHASKEALAGCTVDILLLWAILAKRYGHKISVIEVAETRGQSSGTASNHTSKVRLWLEGERREVKDKERRKGAEELAIEAAERQLYDMLEPIS